MFCCCNPMKFIYFSYSYIPKGCMSYINSF